MKKIKQQLSFIDKKFLNEPSPFLFFNDKRFF